MLKMHPCQKSNKATQLFFVSMLIMYGPLVSNMVRLNNFQLYFWQRTRVEAQIGLENW